MSADPVPACPVHAGRDDRKSAALAEANVRPRDDATSVITDFGTARTMLHRQDATGEVTAISLRGANVDEAAVGECPLALDPDRAKRQKMASSWVSFGDGNHRCPGAQVALHESRVFLDRLMKIPGVALARRPDMTWNNGIMSYELRGAVVTFGSASA